jgi:tetratricopeptide (TPR) repeat protein
MYDQEWSPKAVKLFREALALDPDGKTGTTDYDKKKVPYTEYTEYILGYAAFASPARDVKPLRVFIKKYPQSPMLRMAFTYVGIQLGYQGSKEEAREFFEEYIAKYPDDPNILHQYVLRIIRDKEPLDKGLELAKKIAEILKANTDPRFVKSLAELYLLKGEAKEAEKNYGPNYMDGKALMFAMNLMDYAEFWLKQKKNEANALAMIDTALKIKPDYWYINQRAAQVLINQMNEARALEIFGPSFAKKHWDTPSNLYSYAVFWSRQGKNLDSALEAAKRVVEKEPFQAYNWDGLAQVSLKLKKYDEAIKAEEEAIKLAEGSAVGVFKKRLETIRKAKAEGK